MQDFEAGQSILAKDDTSVHDGRLVPEILIVLVKEKLDMYKKKHSHYRNLFLFFKMTCCADGVIAASETINRVYWNCNKENHWSSMRYEDYTNLIL